MTLAIGAVVASAALLWSPLRPALPRSRASLPRAIDDAADVVFADLQIDRDAVNRALESQEQKKAEEARMEAAAAWRELEEALPPVPDAPAPVLTLYRDTNGWCPFCERGASSAAALSRVGRC